MGRKKFVMLRGSGIFENVKCYSREGRETCAAIVF